MKPVTEVCKKTVLPSGRSSMERKCKGASLRVVLARCDDLIKKERKKQRRSNRVDVSRKQVSADVEEIEEPSGSRASSKALGEKHVRSGKEVGMGSKAGQVAFEGDVSLLSKRVRYKKVDVGDGGKAEGVKKTGPYGGDVVTVDVLYAVPNTQEVVSVGKELVNRRQAFWIDRFDKWHDMFVQSSSSVVSQPGVFHVFTDEVVAREDWPVS